MKHILTITIIVLACVYAYLIWEKPMPRTSICEDIHTDIIADERNGKEWQENGDVDILMHTVGCDYDSLLGEWQYGGEGVRGGGCNATAYLYAKTLIQQGGNFAGDDGVYFGEVATNVRARGCVQYEDGTYGIP